jgi:hypothetical protein
MKDFIFVYTSASIEHIKGIVRWYNERQKGLGQRFKSHLKDELRLVKKNPFYLSFRYDNIRFAVLKKFPYAAHYSVDEQKRLIIVHAVFGFKEGLGLYH